MLETVKRTCSVEGCDKQLGSANQSGRCTKHFYVPKGARRGVAAVKPKILSTGMRVLRRGGAKRGAAPAGEVVAVAVHESRLAELFANLPPDARAVLLSGYFSREA